MTYLPSNLCDSSDGSDNSDSCDDSDNSYSCDSSDSSDQKTLCTNKLLKKKLFFKKKTFFLIKKKILHLKTHNSNCDEIRNSNFDETQKLKL